MLNLFNILRPRKNGRHFADDVFKCIFRMKMLEFRWKFNWSLFPIVQSTITQAQQWFRSWLGLSDLTLDIMHGNITGHRIQHTWKIKFWYICHISGGWVNIKMSSYQYRESYCGDKTILRPSYLLNGSFYTGKMTSLYWIRAQTIAHILLDFAYAIQITFSKHLSHQACHEMLLIIENSGKWL